MEPDIYSLFAGSAPTAQQQAKLLAEALRGKRQQADMGRAIGNLGMLTGDKVLGQFGGAQIQQAGQTDANANQREGMLAQSGGERFRAALEREKMGYARQAAAAGDAAAKTKQALDLTEGYRKEFNGLPQVKQFTDVKTSYDKVKNALAKPSAAGDMAGIFAFMKMLDPGSSVREGEFANAQNAAGVDGRIVNAYNSILSGQRLSPEQRADFLGQAQNAFAAHKTQFDSAAKRYSDLAKKNGVDPSDVIFGFDAPQVGDGVSAPKTLDDPLPPRSKDEEDALPTEMQMGDKRYRLNPKTGKYAEVSGG